MRLHQSYMKIMEFYVEQIHDLEDQLEGANVQLALRQRALEERNREIARLKYLLETSEGLRKHRKENER